MRTSTNAVYLQWLDRIAWTHAAKTGHALGELPGHATRHGPYGILESTIWKRHCSADNLLLATWLVACERATALQPRRFEVSAL